jgi:ABC-type lipoprotein export system ATPase subunit
MSLVVARDLWREYSQGGVAALAGVDVDIAQGEFVALLGRSGSGKSTLLNLLGGLDRPTRGSISVQGRDLATMNSREVSLYRRTTVGFIFQSFNLVPTLPAWENVALPLVFQGVSRAQRRRSATQMLEKVGLGARGNHRPSQMSGGEQQRVAIARALANRPQLLLCDEPTGNLDTSTSAQIMQLIVEAHAAGVTIVMVTHDPELARIHATRTIRMADGRIASLTPEAA